MKTRLPIFCWIPALLFALTGCASPKYAERIAYSDPAPASLALTELSTPSASTPSQDRMLVRKASLSFDVWNVSNSVAQAESFATQQGGYAEYKSDDHDGYASLKLRIPVQAFTNALLSLESLGEITSRYVENEDVTEQYVDTAARLKNKVVLRDRLRQLLDKATAIKDILAIETELNRVQSDIDSMEAVLQSLQSQADYATLNLTFHRKQIPGPLGYVFKGIWWTVSKLFFLRE